LSQFSTLLRREAKASSTASPAWEGAGPAGGLLWWDGGGLLCAHGGGCGCGSAWSGVAAHMAASAGARAGVRARQSDGWDGGKIDPAIGWSRWRRGHGYG
jgi:hypothetical protein